MTTREDVFALLDTLPKADLEAARDHIDQLLHTAPLKQTMGIYEIPGTVFAEAMRGVFGDYWERAKTMTEEEIAEIEQLMMDELEEVRRERRAQGGV